MRTFESPYWTCDHVDPDRLHVGGTYVNTQHLGTVLAAKARERLLGAEFTPAAPPPARGWVQRLLFWLHQ